MVELLDYAGTLGRAQGLVPDYAQQQLQQRLADMQLQSQGLQNRQTEQQIAANDRDVSTEKAFQDDVKSYLDDPSKFGREGLFLKHPTYAKQIKDGFLAQDTATQNSSLREMTSLYGLVSNGKPEVAAAQIKRRIDGSIARGEQADPIEQAIYDQLSSGDAKQIRQAQNLMRLNLSAIVGAEKFGSTFGDLSEGDTNKGYTLSPGQQRYDAEGNLLNSAPFAPRPVTVGEGQTVVEYQPGGGGPASGDTSRLINNDAGGGYVPDGVKTLGQFVNFGKSLNRNGAKSSSAGTYQINGSTMAEFAPRVLGKDWQQAPFSADTQERVAESIFNWAKAQPDPATALRGRWVSLTPQESSRLVQGDWSQARGLIAQKESGGGTSAGPRVIAQGGAKQGYQVMTPQEVQAAGLNPAVRYQRSPDGNITAIGGQDTKTTKARAVPDSTAKRVEGQVGIRDSLTDSIRSFQDDFAGNTLTGGLENTMQSWFGTGTPGQRDWWANFRSNDNQIRNELFGAALTAQEKASYEATTISERMAPAQIRKNLTRRNEIIRRALNRQQNFLKKNGYDAEAVDALYLEDALSGGSPAQAAAPASGGAFKILSVRPK